MPRAPRYHVPGDFCHVIARGNHQEDIFRDESDYRYYLSLMDRYSARHDVKVHAYALMTNHIHLLVQEGSQPLGRFVQGVHQCYARYANARYEKTGHLFQGRYKANRVDGDTYLLALVRYIHLNPVEAGLAEDPAGYRWSSHRHYNGEPGEGTVETVFIRELMATSTGEIGDYRLMEKDARKADEKAGSMAAPVRSVGSAASECQRIPFTEIMRRVEAFTRLNEKQITGPRSDRPTSTARRLFMYAAVEEGYPLAEIARYVRRAAAGVTLAIQAIEEDLQQGGPWRDVLQRFHEET
ncbi:MAG: transposase [Bacillota bacterium]